MQAPQVLPTRKQLLPIIYSSFVPESEVAPAEQSAQPELESSTKRLPNRSQQTEPISNLPESNLHLRNENKTASSQPQSTKQGLTSKSEIQVASHQESISKKGSSMKEPLIGHESTEEDIV